MWLHQICIHAWQNICMFTHVELVDTPAPPFLLGGMTAAFAFLSSPRKEARKTRKVKLVL